MQFPKNTLKLDLETYSECNLKKCGVYKYAQHPSTGITLFAYKFDDGPLRVWDLTQEPEMPADLALHIDVAEYFCAHNSNFDRNVLEVKFPELFIGKKWIDTMVLAYLHSLPGALGQLSDIFALADGEHKMAEGKELVHLFCKPNKKGERNTYLTHSRQWATFKKYAGVDISAMDAIAKKMPSWNISETEMAYWAMDTRINDRGFSVDIELAERAAEVLLKAKDVRDGRTQELTGNEVDAASKRDKLLKHILEAHGVPLPDMAKATLERRIADPELPEVVKELLRIRLQSASTAGKKYQVLLDAVCADGKLHGTLQFCGAFRTGRWSGRIYQPQNLPRPTLKNNDVDFAIEAVKSGCLHLLHDSPVEPMSSALRGAIVASPGKKLCVADLSAIEGRGIAYLAGEKWKIKAYEDYDAGIGFDMYVSTYAKAFLVKPEEVGKKERQLGKVLELACLGGDTEVLTNNGYKKITKVLLTDRLWDGHEWVSHSGVICKGEKEVICLDGIELTPDHLVRLSDQWIQSQSLVSSENMLCRALATGSENLPSQGFLQTKQGTSSAETSFGCGAPVGLRSTGCMNTTSEKGPAHVATIAQKSKQTTGENNIGVTQTSYQTVLTGDACLTESARVLPDAKKGAIGTTEGGVYMYTALGLKGQRAAGHILDTLCRLKDGTTQTWRSIGSMSRKVTNPETCASSPTSRIQTTEEKSRICSTNLIDSEPKTQGSRKKIKTYDVLLAGSRNCFTVRSTSGHLIVHNCGYGGGVGAFITFATAYGINLDDLADTAWGSLADWAKQSSTDYYNYIVEKNKSTYDLRDKTFIACDAIKRMWRSANPMIAKLWKDLGDACKTATCGGVTRVGLLEIDRKGVWLRVKLPSGRYLSYPGARCDGDQLSYLGVNQYSRKWGRLRTYGGKLVENATQAFCRDIFAHGLLLAESKGYLPVLSIHDELVAETPDSPEFTVAEMVKCLCTNPPWAVGMPLAAAGFESYRYKKD
jgi:hypothetical protein